MCKTNLTVGFECFLQLLRLLRTYIFGRKVGPLFGNIRGIPQMGLTYAYSRRNNNTEQVQHGANKRNVFLVLRCFCCKAKAVIQLISGQKETIRCCCWLKSSVNFSAVEQRTILRMPWRQSPESFSVLKAETNITTTKKRDKISPRQELYWFSKTVPRLYVLRVWDVSLELYQAASIQHEGGCCCANGGIKKQNQKSGSNWLTKETKLLLTNN